MFDQGRDTKFEVQFLLSLTLVVFGLMSQQTINDVTFESVGYVLIFFVSTYLSVFVLMYSVEEALSIRVDFLSSMDEISWPLLLAISTVFIYYIGHVIVSVVVDVWVINSYASSLNFIKLVVPILPILVMVPVYEDKVKGPVQSFSDINIKIIPDSVRVFDQKDDRPITIKVENLGDALFDYELQIDIPDDVTLVRNESEFQEEFQQERTVEPKRADRLNFYPVHSLTERTNEILVVRVDFDGGYQEKEVPLKIES